MVMFVISQSSLPSIFTDLASLFNLEPSHDIQTVLVIYLDKYSLEKADSLSLNLLSILLSTPSKGLNDSLRFPLLET